MCKLESGLWSQAALAQEDLLDPLQNGYHKDDDGIRKPATTDASDQRQRQ